jgi:hypothetical protein
MDAIKFLLADRYRQIGYGAASDKNGRRSF